MQTMKSFGKVEKREGKVECKNQKGKLFSEKSDIVSFFHFDENGAR